MKDSMGNSEVGEEWKKGGEEEVEERSQGRM